MEKCPKCGKVDNFELCIDKKCPNIKEINEIKNEIQNMLLKLNFIFKTEVKIKEESKI